jgi:hypothetical protein
MANLRIRGGKIVFFFNLLDTYLSHLQHFLKVLDE